MRKILFLLLTVCLSVCTFLSVFSFTASAESEKMIEFSVNLEKVRFEDSTHRLFSLFAPFNSKGYGYTTFAISDGAVLSYEFYSSEPLSGVGGVELQIKYNNKKGATIYGYLSNKLDGSGVKDDKGYGVSFFEDLTEDLGNGWYKREIKINYADIASDITALYLEHFFVAFCPTVEEINGLKENGRESVELCYKNIKFTSISGKTTTVFDGTEKCMIMPEFWHDFKFEPHSIGYGDKGIGLDIFDPLTNYDASEDDTFSVNMSVKEAVNPLTIIENLENNRYFTQTQYNFKELVSTNKSGATITVESITSQNGNSILSDTATFTDAGKYKVKLVAELNAERAILYADIQVYDIKEPVFIEEETAKFLTEWVAGDRYEFPEIVAYVGESVTRPVSIKVFAPNGEEFECDGEGFTPTKKIEGEYKICLTAVNEGIERTAYITVKVIDKDKPVFADEQFDFELLIGQWITIPNIKATDLTDGVIDVESITVINPLGQEVVLNDGSFLVNYSGEYKIVASVTDADGNTVNKTVYKTAKQGREDTFVLRAYVEQANRKKGVRKFLHLSLYSSENSIFTFSQGDRICYDVYSTTPMAGIGGVSGQITGNYAGTSWPFWHTLYGEMVDKNGYSAMPTTDLTNAITDGNGNPVWYQREIPISIDLLGANTGLFSIVIDTTSACGEYIEVFYRNFRIEREDGRVVNILPSSMEVLPKVWETLNIEDNVLVAAISDKPVILEELLPTNVQLGEQVFVSDRVVYDYNAHSLLGVSTFITDPTGKKVDATKRSGGYVFVPVKQGKYTVTYVDANNNEYVYKISALDETPPVIEIGEYQKTCEKGNLFTMPSIEITDVGTAYEYLDISIKCFSSSGEVEIIDGKVLMDKVGTYTIVVEVVDAGENETYQTLRITCEEKQPTNSNQNKKGCNSSITAPVSALVLLFAITKIRRRKI